MKVTNSILNKIATKTKSLKYKLTKGNNAHREFEDESDDDFGQTKNQGSTEYLSVKAKFTRSYKPLSQ